MDVLTESLRNVISGLHKTLRKSYSDDVPFSLTELETISLLYQNPQILPSELAVKTKITMPSMSQILKKMETKGIIQRTPSEDDGRKVYISLTAHGIQFVEKVKSGKNEILKNLIEAKLTENEISVLKKAIPVLKKLNSY
jgi:DNA-binding MarR family transcriptional regulator